MTFELWTVTNYLWKHLFQLVLTNDVWLDWSLVLWLRLSVWIIPSPRQKKWVWSNDLIWATHNILVRFNDLRWSTGESLGCVFLIRLWLALAQKMSLYYDLFWLYDFFEPQTDKRLVWFNDLITAQDKDLVWSTDLWLVIYELWQMTYGNTFIKLP